MKTGNKSNAGTSAKVYAILYGGKDGNQTSGKVWLQGGAFNRDRTDVFNVEVAEMLGRLSRIDIGHDNSGAGAGWFLDQVSDAHLSYSARDVVTYSFIRHVKHCRHFSS